MPPASEVAVRPIVGVIGSGDAACEDRARAVGTWLAHEGVHLLTGGGGGVMAAVSRAFCSVPDRLGLSIGILPADETTGGGRARPGYPNPWIEIPIYTHLPLSGPRGTEPLSRNHLNVLTSAAIVALPGGAGTLSEILLAGRYGRPVIAYLHDPAEIVGLPADVRCTAHLAEVQAYVRNALARAERHDRTHPPSVR